MGTISEIPVKRRRVFDSDRHLVGVLNANADVAKGRVYILLSKLVLQRSICDFRLGARGHDVTDLLAYFVADSVPEGKLRIPLPLKFVSC